MSRKSSKSDLKLIFEGRKLLVKKGASALSIRELCLKANVNLGMFNYYFKTKDRFIEKVLEKIYYDFIVDLSLIDKGQGIESLRQNLCIIAKFARDNRSLILSLMNDILNEEKSVKKFVKTKMKKHFVILEKSLRECQNEKIIVDLPLPVLMTQILSGIGLSNLMIEFIKRLGATKAFNLNLKDLTNNLVSDEVLNQRIDIILKGIKV